MKLKEMKRFPKKADKAKLYFSKDKDLTVPYRENDQIFLPSSDQNAEFFRLQKARQFLFRLPAGNTQSSWRNFFGGTDHRPFLVELDYKAFEIFKRKGSKAFYETLKPEIITRLEERFKVSSKRQGDIWAVPIPYGWDDIKFFLLLFGGKKEAKILSLKLEHIFDTRHRFTGSCIDGIWCQDLFPDEIEPNPILVEGKLEAADHLPLKLDGMHVLAQTEHLINPSDSD